MPKSSGVCYQNRGKDMATLHIVETSRWPTVFSADTIIEKTTLPKSHRRIRMRHPQWLSHLSLWTWSPESQGLRHSAGDREGLWGQEESPKKAFAPLWVSEHTVGQKLSVRRNLETFTKFWLLHCTKFIFLTWFYFFSQTMQG